MSRSMASDRLAVIREADAIVAADLQMYPPAYTHRRELLAAHDAVEEVLADHDRLVRELDVLINGPGAAQAPKLVDIVAQLHRMNREMSAMTAALKAQRPETGHPMECGCAECM